MTSYHTLLIRALARRTAEYQQEYKRRVNAKRGNPTKRIVALEEKRIILVLLSHALVEALANLYLSRRLDPKRFARVDHEGVIKKWNSVFNSFLPSYRLPPDLASDLESLNQRRIGIAHMKPRLTENGKLVHSGNPPMLSLAEHERTIRWTNLPLKLVENLGLFDKDVGGDLSFSTWFDFMLAKPIAKGIQSREGRKSH